MDMGAKPFWRRVMHPMRAFFGRHHRRLRPVFADSTPENAILVRIRFDKYLVFRDYLELA